MERIVNAMEENPDRESIKEVSKDYTAEHAITVTEKAVQTFKPKTINPAGENLSSDVVHDFMGFMMEPIKEIMKRMWIW